MPPHIFLATPCYGGLVSHRYMHGVLALLLHAASSDLRVHVETLAKESLITRGRNTLAAKFLAQADATHLLFVDADIGFVPANVLRLLTFDVDVAAGIYPLKLVDWDEAAVTRARQGELITTAPLRYVGKPCENSARRTRDGFATADYAGTGFMLIRRRVFEAMAAAYPELQYVTGHHTAEIPGSAQHAFFECVIDPSTRHYLSEDYAFCKRWRAMGGDIWLDLDSSLTHVGSAEFVGDPKRRFVAT